MEEEHIAGNFNVCVSCTAPPTVRDFLMPGIIHYMKSVFTRYQLVTELFQTECEAAAEQAESAEQMPESPGAEQAESAEPDWFSTLRLAARESAEAYSREVEPFVLLINTLYTSPEVIAKKFSLDSCTSAGPSDSGPSDSAVSIMAELLKTSAAFSGARINTAPRVAELPLNYCCRMFGPISSVVYLMIKEGGAERVEIGVLEEDGRLSLTISSKAELHRKTTKVLEGCGCTGVDSGLSKDSSRVPCSVLCRYSCTKGIGTLLLPAFRSV